MGDGVVPAESIAARSPRRRRQACGVPDAVGEVRLARCVKQMNVARWQHREDCS
jgi:hypothetical protein